MVSLIQLDANIEPPQQLLPAFSDESPIDLSSYVP